MSSVNKVILIGNLGKDPEMKFHGERAKCSFSLATNERWTKDGQKQEKTTWHNIVCWGKTAELCVEYLSKGRQVYLEGKIDNRSWDKDDGTKGYISEVVAREVTFLGSKQDAAPKEDHDYGPPPMTDDQDVPF